MDEDIYKIPDFNKGEGISVGDTVTVWAMVYRNYAVSDVLEPVRITRVKSKGPVSITTEEKRKYCSVSSHQHSGSIVYSTEVIRKNRPEDAILIEISKIRIDVCKLSKYIDNVLSFQLAVKTLEASKTSDVPAFLIKSREHLVGIANVLTKLRGKIPNGRPTHPKLFLEEK